VTALQPGLLYSNSRVSIPTSHTIKCVADLVNSRLVSGSSGSYSDEHEDGCLQSCCAM
jgi:hypothetical protein